MNFKQYIIDLDKIFQNAEENLPLIIVIKTYYYSFSFFIIISFGVYLGFRFYKILNVEKPFDIFDAHYESDCYTILIITNFYLFFVSLLCVEFFQLDKILQLFCFLFLFQMFFFCFLLRNIIFNFKTTNNLINIIIGFSLINYMFILFFYFPETSWGFKGFWLLLTFIILKVNNRKNNYELDISYLTFFSSSVYFFFLADFGVVTDIWITPIWLFTTIFARKLKEGLDRKVFFQISTEKSFKNWLLSQIFFINIIEYLLFSNSIFSIISFSSLIITIINIKGLYSVTFYFFIFFVNIQRNAINFKLLSKYDYKLLLVRSENNLTNSLQKRFMHKFGTAVVEAAVKDPLLAATTAATLVGTVITAVSAVSNGSNAVLHNEVVELHTEVKDLTVDNVKKEVKIEAQEAKIEAQKKEIEDLKGKKPWF